MAVFGCILVIALVEALALWFGLLDEKFLAKEAARRAALSDEERAHEDFVDQCDQATW
jgi:hypothetical protein